MAVRTRKRSVVALTAGVLAAVTALSTASYAAGAPRPRAGQVEHKSGAGPNDHGGEHGGEHGARGGFDARRGSSADAQAAVLQRAARANARPATTRLKASLGGQSIVDIDGTTQTPRLVAKLNGFLTPPSSTSARLVTLHFVEQNRAALGLARRDLATLRLSRTYVDVDGVQHLSWTQRIHGVEVFGNGLESAVTRDGRLLALGGSPVSRAAAVPSGSRKLASADAAISAARHEQGDRGAKSTPGPRDVAAPVLFVTPSGTHLGWRTITMSADNPALTVLDAHTGRPLFRRPLSSDATSSEDSRGLAFRYYPGAATGGTQGSVDYTAKGWLAANATRLAGNNSHTYSDVNDDNQTQVSEEVAPSGLSPSRWNYRLKPFALPDVSFCGSPFPCSWDPNTPFSWQANRAQNAAQVFFFVNKWHDHLLAAPIGFTEAAGNFEASNSTGAGLAGDAVDTQTDDGANTAAGLPDGSHVDNANMSTPPDGQSPRMQMFLQHRPGTAYPDGDPFSPTNVGDEADTVYHEYTHGMSNRLVVDAGGNSTLGPVQAGAMGEAWSDWYAMDFLVAQGLQPDPPDTNIVLFQYDGAGAARDRTEPIDCKVGSTSSLCTGAATGHIGGYTYADYGKVVGRPEVHGDGEIWSQTLWDLRDALGSKKTEALVTRGMELSPSNPSFLDERNSILLADLALFNGANDDVIWKVFAQRGMGFYAGALGGDDAAPGADFSTPPVNPPAASLSGRVTDSETGAPVGGATVTLAFQGGGGTVNPSATTGDDGRYTIGPVPVGTYPKLFVSGAGYDPLATSVTITPTDATRNLVIRRDWAASSGGATIAGFNGPNLGVSCDPVAAIDNNPNTGWSTTTGDDVGTPTNVFVPKFITIDMGRAVNVTQFAVDPSATCRHGGSASTGDYRIEVSANGTDWSVAATGTFGLADRGRLNPVSPTTPATTVRYARFTVLGNQTPDFANGCPAGGFAGCSFTDLTEFEVYGTAATP
ncbi:MAG: M36 family metallopeptidase [Nocardioidaceae bacterium]